MPCCVSGRLAAKRTDPLLQGHGLETAFQQRVVGMAMRIDEARQQQSVGRVDGLYIVGPFEAIPVQIGGYVRYHTFLDSYVGYRRMVRVTVVIVDATTLDKEGYRASHIKREKDAMRLDSNS